MHHHTVRGINDVRTEIRAVILGSASKLVRCCARKPLLASRAVNAKGIRPAHDLDGHVAGSIVCEVPCWRPTVEVNEGTCRGRAVPELHETPRPNQCCGLIAAGGLRHQELASSARRS